MDLNTLRTNIANNVKSLRKMHAHSQECLAEKLDCGKERVSKLECCKIAFAEDLIIKLCNIYNVTPSYLYRLKTDEEDKQNIINEIIEITQDYDIDKLKKLLVITKVLK